MNRILTRLFNVRSEEWPRLLLLYLINLILLTGIYWGDEIIEAGFLRLVGVNYLPQVMMLNALCSVLAITIYTAFADQVANNRLLIAILGVGAAGIALGMALWGLRLTGIAYGLFYLTAQVPLRTILNVHWATFVNGFYDTRAAKRIVPLLGSAVRLAGVASGLTMPLLNRFLSPMGIIAIWLGAILVTILLISLTPRLLRQACSLQEPRSATRSTSSAPQFSRWLDHIRDGYRYVAGSSFLRWLALATLLMVVLLQVVDYQTKRVFAGLDTVQAISNLTGALRGWSNLVALPFQLFFLGRIIAWTGLGTASMIFPVGTALASLGLILVPGLPTASMGQLVRTTLRTTFRNPIDSLLYNAVPLRVKGRARAFIGGAVVPVGEFIGGLLLLILQGTVRLPAWLLPAALATLALGHLLGAWGVRRQYTKALIEMLDGQDFSFLLGREATALSMVDPATLRLLQERLEQPDTGPEFAVFMTQLIAQVGGSRAVPLLDGYIRRTDDAFVRASTVDALVAAEVDDGQVRRLYADLLTDPDARVRRSALNGLERLSDPGDAHFQSLALTLLNDPDLQVRVLALTALARTRDLYGFPPALDALDALLQSADPDQRAQGVHVLRLVYDLGGHLRVVDRLLDYLVDPADEVRLQAVLAIESLAVAAPNLVAADAVAHLVTDPVERVRQAATVILGAIGSPQAYQAILTALNDPMREVRATAVDVLVRAGQTVASMLRPLLSAHDSHLTRMAACVLGRIDPLSYAPLLQEHVEQTLIEAYRICAQIAALEELDDASSLDALRSALNEQNEWLLDEVFDLLGALHGDTDVRVVQTSLRSQDAHVRANAVEALESLAGRVARLIAPLVDPDVTLADRLALGRETWKIESLSARQTFDALVAQPGAVSLRSIAVFALGEMGAAMVASRPEEAAKDVRRGRSVGALLGRLIDGPLPDSSANARPPAAQPRARAAHLDLPVIETWVQKARTDSAPPVRVAALAAQQMMDGLSVIERAREEGFVLSTIEKMMALKKVPFFQNMTIEQLTVVADVCEEMLVEEDTRIFEQDELGGALYVVVSGRVAIEREGRRRGSTVRLAEMGANSYFGEMSLFDGGPRSAAAVAIQGSLLLRLRREPLLALLRRYPDLSLELIDVLNQRLRDANERIAELSQSRPRELQKLYDKLNFDQPS